MRVCKCAACRARDARRFENLVHANYNDNERARLAQVGTPDDKDRVRTILETLKAETTWDVPT